MLLSIALAMASVTTSFNVRRDGSSRFGANNRYGTFPSASINWRLGDESFMQGQNIIANLSLRASYGITGNQQGLGNFESRALFNGVLTITAIYVLVNVALLYVLPMSRIAGKEFAAGEAANVIFGQYGDTIFRCITIVSMLSAINALHLMATRVIFAMSRDGLFTERAAVVNAGGTPTVSLLLR